VIPRLGIYGVRFADGPRGVVLEGGATTFPVTMARGATWDVELEARIGDAIGKELQALGANLYGDVCINPLRHPAWGRAQETYGEDPVLLGALGAALCRGVQRHAMACVKHFALNDPGDTVLVSVVVRNTGSRDAEEVVQLYAEPIGSAIERAPRELRGFARLAVPAGETRVAEIPLAIRSLAWFDEARDDFAVERIAYDLIAARHERDDRAPRVRIRVRS
jgi:beta-glucosidase-like glycosyl hydrolase